MLLKHFENKQLKMIALSRLSLQTSIYPINMSFPHFHTSITGN